MRFDNRVGRTRGQRRKLLRRKPRPRRDLGLLSRGSKVRILPGAPHFRLATDKRLTIGTVSRSFFAPFPRAFRPRSVRLQPDLGGLANDRLQLTAALPESRHRATELFIRDVQAVVIAPVTTGDHSKGTEGRECARL